jgi:acyl carrier protein
MGSDDEESAVNGTGGLLARLRLAPISRRPELLSGSLREHIAKKLILEPSEVDARAPLMALGMSSLQAMEIKMYLEKELAASLPASLLFDYPTVASLAGQILDKLGLAATRPAASDSSRLSVDTGADTRGDLDVAQTLARELAELRRQGVL